MLRKAIMPSVGRPSTAAAFAEPCAEGDVDGVAPATGMDAPPRADAEPGGVSAARLGVGTTAGCAAPSVAADTAAPGTGGAAALIAAPLADTAGAAGLTAAAVAAATGVAPAAAATPVAGVAPAVVEEIADVGAATAGLSSADAFAAQSITIALAKIILPKARPLARFIASFPTTDLVILEELFRGVNYQ